MYSNQLDSQAGNPPEKSNKKAKTPRKIIFARIVGIIFVVSLSVFIFLIRDKANQLAIYGYPGAFVITFMAYATVILPAPGLAIVFSMAGFLNPFILGLVAGTAAALGETVGYIAGFSGQVTVENRPQYNRIMVWMNKNAPITIFLLASFPNPFFDLAGIAAGIFRVPILKFFFFCWLGVTLKMMVFSFLGAYAFDFFSRLF